MVFMASNGKFLLEFSHRKTASESWVVNILGSVTASGKREQHFFKTRDLAKDHRAMLREKLFEDGSKSNAITPSLAEDVTQDEAILAPWGA